MKKLMKKTMVACAAATMMMIGMGSLSASAGQVVSNENKATFKWGPGYSQMINNSTTVRLANAYTNVYRDISGEYVNQGTAGGNIGYGANVKASTPGYTSNGYNFECNGGIYRANSQYSPFDWGVTHYVD